MKHVLGTILLPALAIGLAACGDGDGGSAGASGPPVAGRPTVTGGSRRGSGAG
ncbi:hypothetical protein AB0L25_11750 [Spirillospora sp. NPDC052242]